MRVLVTGATGVLGRAAVPRLVAAGHQVVGLARSRAGRAWLESVGAQAGNVDLFDPVGVRPLVAGSDAVIHLATAIPPVSQMTQAGAWEMNDRLRREATCILVDSSLASDVRRFVQASITFIYADGGDDWLVEDAPIAPSSPVLLTALEAEREAARMTSAGRIGVVLRFGRLYGRGKAVDDYLEAVRRRGMPIVGGGRNWVSSIHEDDAGAAIAAALDVEAGTYNVVDDQPVRSAPFVSLVAELLGAPPPRRVPTWLARIAARQVAGLLATSQRVSNARFKAASGWTPAVPSAEEGWPMILAGDKS